MLARKVVGRVRRRLITVPRDSVIKVINGTVRYEFQWLPFLFDEDMRAMFTGTYDLILCDCLRENLSSGDIVLDVGANVGYISAIAASYVGKTGEVHGFEPLGMCFDRLRVLSALNPEFRFVFNNVALGDQDAELLITYDPQGQSRNATLIPGTKAAATASVPVRRLDNYIKTNISSPERIRLIKIDVEGYEFPVLRGLECFLSAFCYRPLIVCEIKPWELKKLGFSMDAFQQYMKKFDYIACDMVDPDKPVDLLQMEEMEVVLFRT